MAKAIGGATAVCWVSMMMMMSKQQAASSTIPWLTGCTGCDNTTQAMVHANQMINLPQMQETMAEYQRQSDLMGMNDEYVGMYVALQLLLYLLTVAW
jgi:hypothetical protein